MDHETETIIIKEAEVDKGIACLVKFLNEQPGIQTRFSCQGDDAKGIIPYVNFIAENPNSLAEFLKTWKDYRFATSIYIEHYADDFNPFLLNVILVNESHLKQLQRMIEEDGN
ncbi:hypothetical protein LCGC14_0932830 [marine sediment metagenome]|uniref:Uncharacterized protein n=1 Tax=marine sediment metagenome TaxID=412755 RepID=A0A0F9R5Y1_9ZZZZ